MGVKSQLQPSFDANNDSDIISVRNLRPHAYFLIDSSGFLTLNTPQRMILKKRGHLLWILYTFGLSP